jgi:undecaprenyl-diphosphatase
MSTWQVVLLGLIEGLTEFIPVSSTGHLLLAGHFLGFRSPGKTFEVLIQLGAVLAVLSVYARKLVGLAVGLPYDWRARRFVFGLFVAFLPAAVIGAAAHGLIKAVLFESPLLVCTTLILGGVVLLAMDRWRRAPAYADVMEFPVGLAFTIGLFQCLALVPGVSRSGATIVGGLLLGADKRSAAEFSFYIAMPTMAGAFTYDLYKNWTLLAFDDLKAIGLGFVVAFVAAVFVVRFLLDFVARHGFEPFAWWRILVGGAGLGAIMILG